jgi:hypothetical protein
MARAWVRYSTPVMVQVDADAQTVERAVLCDAELALAHDHRGQWVVLDDQFHRVETAGDDGLREGQAVRAAEETPRQDWLPLPDWGRRLQRRRGRRLQPRRGLLTVAGYAHCRHPLTRHAMTLSVHPRRFTFSCWPVSDTAGPGLAAARGAESSADARPLRGFGPGEGCALKEMYPDVVVDAQN